jgi:iron uptake system component EfeO
MARFSSSRRFGAVLVLGLAAAALSAPHSAFAAGDPSKPASYAPDEPLLALLDGKAAAFREQVAAPDLQALGLAVDRLAVAVQQHDLAAARQAWLDAHAIWARCDAFTADLYPGLEKKINEFPDAGSGFHAIEATLFAAQPSVDARQVQALIDDVQTYQRVFAQTKFNGYYLIAAASTWAFELGNTLKEEGGESPVSGNSLVDFKNNMAGIERTWRFVFADSVRAKKHFLAEQIDDQIAGIKAMLDVPSLDQIQVEAYQEETTKLASLLATASSTLGWRAPDYTDLGE